MAGHSAEAAVQESFEDAKRQGEADPSGRPRGERHRLEPGELAWGLPRSGRKAHVSLHHVGPASSAGVGDGQAGQLALARPVKGDPGESEGGVAQPVSEREQRLDAMRLIPAVADVEAGGIPDGAVHPGEAVSGGGEGGCFGSRESDGQPAGRVHPTEEDGGHGGPVFLPRVPGLEDPLNVGQPRHENGPTGVQHHHGMGVGPGDRVDEGVRVAGQVEAGPVDAFALLFTDEHQRHFGGVRDTYSTGDER